MKKPYPIRCGWCETQFKTSEEQDMHTPDCPIRNAVHDAERRAGRVLKFAEVKVVRDRARAGVVGAGGKGGTAAVVEKVPAKVEAPRRMSYATVETGEEENEEGVMVECVFAVCAQSDHAVTIWGTSEASVLRALATLTEECSCGAGFHKQK